MTRSEIDAVLERVRTWPLELTVEEVADLKEALAEAKREGPVPDEEVKALFDRYRLPRH